MNMVLVGRDEGGKKNIRTFWRMDAIETSEPEFVRLADMQDSVRIRTHLPRRGGRCITSRSVLLRQVGISVATQCAPAARGGRLGNSRTTLWKGTEPESGRSGFRRRKRRALRELGYSRQLGAATERGATVGDQRRTGACRGTEAPPPF